MAKVIRKEECTDDLGRPFTVSVIECTTCGKELDLWHNDQECECGACYNINGQEYKTRAQRERERHHGYNEEY